MPAALAASTRTRLTGTWWTLPAIAAGMCIIATVLVVAQVEENRQISWQKNKLQMDLDYFKQQAKVNQEFLSRIETDVNLAERLAQRQMKLVREGSAVLELKGTPAQTDNSPFHFTRIAPPPEVKPYEPAPGVLSHLLAAPRTRGLALGAGALLVAIGLIMGFSGAQKRP